MKLSFVVPIYNVEKYLLQCLNSIYAIMTDDTEMILVNDGSTDNCPSIAEKFAKDKSNVTYISQENKGLSGARNTGLKIAHGNYIWFIDSDDFLKKDTIDTIEKVFAVDADIYCLNTITCDETGNYKGNISRGIKEGFANSLNVYKHFVFPFSGVPFYIFRRNFLIDNRLTFREGILFEDWLFMLKVLALANRCYVINLYPYCYRIRSGSITSSNKSYRYVHDSIEIAKEYNASLGKGSFSKDQKAILYSGTCAMIHSVFKLVFLQLKNKEDKKKSLDSFFSEHIWLGALYKQGTFKQWIQYLLLVLVQLVY